MFIKNHIFGIGTIKIYKYYKNIHISTIKNLYKYY